MALLAPELVDIESDCMMRSRTLLILLVTVRTERMKPLADACKGPLPSAIAECWTGGLLDGSVCAHAALASVIEGDVGA